MSDHPFRFEEGTQPLLVNMPHVGSRIPEAIRRRMTEVGRGSVDSDWHVDRLYDFLSDMGAGTMAASLSRYVVDLNRDPAGVQYYSGFSTPPLVPLACFDGRPLYEPGHAPDEAEVADRTRSYWQPYHEALSRLLARIRERHGIAVLFDCHSIRSLVPRYASEPIPDLNVGTADLTTCAPALRDRVMESLSSQSDYSVVADLIFKGGYTPRHYGRPDEGIHAFQLELSMATYMDEGPVPAFNESKAARLRPVLEGMLHAVIDWARAQPGYRGPGGPRR